MRIGTPLFARIGVVALLSFGSLAILAPAAAGSAVDATGGSPAPPALAPRTSLADLAWLAGHWLGEEDGARREEFWLAPAGGIMLGLHRDTRGPGSSFFEYLRIEARDEGLVYLASPRGGEATEFCLLEAGPGRVVFANPRHDYPQRIIYVLTGRDSLVARIEGTRPGGDGLEATEWNWGRVSAPGASPISGREE